MGQYALFVAASILLILMPGPDTGLVTSNTLSHGKKGGMETVIGITLGLVIHTLSAVVGLSAVIVKSALLFEAFKYIGAVYLLYLGFLSLRSCKNKEHVSLDQDQNKANKGKSCFRQGFLTNVLNPKVAVFFLTFLPQFVETKYNTFMQFLGMGITYTLLTIVWFFLYIYLIEYIREWMKKPSTQRMLQGATGLVLVMFGIKLAFEKRP